MSRKTVKEYFNAIRGRYLSASKELKRLILNEFCLNTGYNRKYAIRRLNTLPSRAPKAGKRQRKPVYGLQVISVILVLWLPWIRKRFQINQAVERQLLSITFLDGLTGTPPDFFR